jgi:hypothetical protein
MTADERIDDDKFVAFGPDQARKARAAAGLPEPVEEMEVPPDAGLVRRIWAFLTQGPGDLRKLWSSERPRSDGDP